MTKPTLIKDGLLTFVVIGLFCCLFVLTYAFHDEPKDLVLDSQESPQEAAVQASIPSSAKIVPPLQKLSATTSVSKQETREPEVKNDVKVTDTKAEAPLIPNTTKTAPEKTIPAEPTKITTPHLSNAATESQYAQELRTRIETATNAFRKKNKVPALSYEYTLGKNAHAYSRTLLSGNFLSHTDTNGCDISCRFKRDDYKASAWGENLAVLKFTDMPDTEEVASFFMREWEKSAGHRENLLSPKFTHQGIGVAISEHAIYVTVQFADPL